MLKKIRKIDYRYYIYFALFSASILLAVFVYPTSYVRLWDSFVNLCTSAIFYVAEVFGINVTVTPGISELVTVDMSNFLPFSVEEMLYKLKALFPSLFTWEYFRVYLLYVLSLIQVVLLVSPMLFGVAVLLGKLIVSAYLKESDRSGRSKPLEVYLSKVRPKIHRVKDWLFDFFDFGAFRHFWKILLAVWIFNLNVATICVAALAFYLFFVACFDFKSLLVNVVNLLADLTIMFAGLPLIAWIIITYVVLDKIRRYIAVKVLHHNEAKNKGFIKNVLSLVNLLVGFMSLGNELSPTH